MEISLTQGQFAIVDDEDFGYLSQFKWYARKNTRGDTFYALRSIKGAKIYMHHDIIGKPPIGLVTDHKDGNGLHNWRDNLRHVTQRQNVQNNSTNCEYTSQYSGVSWYKDCKKWQASIRIKGKPTYLGLFTEEIDAANAYKEAVENIGETLIQDL